jgi:GDPmannose 4,6-dehydratase
MSKGMTALICGVSGQDGTYLADLLLKQGYRVVGTSRDAQINSFANLGRLGIRDRVELRSMSLTDFRSVLTVLAEIEPDEIYNLAGQSSVGLSFEQPVETLESISLGTLNLLEAMRFLGKPIRLYNAGSSECFGDAGEVPADETTAFRPRSPYAVAKATSVWQVANYREAYGLFACSGLLFNHDSPLRPERFVTQKVVRGACRIAAGSQETVRLGDLAIVRDWGWAPDYVEAMHRMIRREQPEDLVIATGFSNSLEAFVEAAFAAVDLDWHDHVKSDPRLHRPADLRVSRADPSRAADAIGWSAKTLMPDVVKRMIEAERERLAVKGG